MSPPLTGTVDMEQTETFVSDTEDLIVANKEKPS